VLNARPDVTAAAGPNYTGFVGTVAGAVGVGGAVRVRANDGGLTTEMNVSVSSVASSDPVEVARELFQIATHPRDFMERLDNGEGEAIMELILDRNADESRRAFAVQRKHNQSDIDVSVIIPLFRRYDLLWNQFLAWSQCSRPDRIELVLVNDDPRHDVDCTELVDQLVGIFGLNVTLVANRVNRGYAASNNVGARMAKGSTLLLLNSDAFLDDVDAVFDGEALLAEHPEIGLVGALIHDADGLVIHQGLACAYLEARSSWFNYHPSVGFPMDPQVSDRWTVVDGVTGAVVMVRKEAFLELGGFAEDFLVGDYEDSDLCWRVNESGKSVVVLDSLRAVHSERTSMSLVGGDELRDRISLFNVWLHAHRWAPFLAARFGGPAEVRS
jgi:GT2 family glycosyltransferase